MYHVFTRRWWKKDNNSRYGKMIPDPYARKTTLARVETEQEAREICQEYNHTHDPGPYSIKAEYMRD